MSKHFSLVMVSCLLLGCSAIADYAASSLIPSATKGGVSAELVVGDKEQTIGNNLEVEAENVDKIVGGDDTQTTVAAPEADEVVVNNTNYPDWLVAVLFIACCIFLALDSPTKLLNWWRKK